MLTFLKEKSVLDYPPRTAETFLLWKKDWSDIVNTNFFFNINNAVNLFFGKTAYNFIISSFNRPILFSAIEKPADKACPPSSSNKPTGSPFIKSTRFIAPLLRQEPFYVIPPLAPKKNGAIVFFSILFAVRPKTPGSNLRFPVIITSGQDAPISESIVFIILSTASFCRHSLFPIFRLSNPLPGWTRW